MLKSGQIPELLKKMRGGGEEEEEEMEQTGNSNGLMVPPVS